MARAQDTNEDGFNVAIEDAQINKNTDTQDDDFITFGTDAITSRKTDGAIVLPEPESSAARSSTRKTSSFSTTSNRVILGEPIAITFTSSSATEPESDLESKETMDDVSSDKPRASDVSSTSNSKNPSALTIGLGVGIPAVVLIIVGGLIIWLLLKRKTQFRRRAVMPAAAVTVAGRNGSQDNDDMSNIYAIGGIEEPLSATNINSIPMPTAIASGSATPAIPAWTNTKDLEQKSVIQVNPFEPLPQYHELPEHRYSKRDTDETDVKEKD